MQTGVTFAKGRDLGEKVCNFFGKMRKGTSGSSILKRIINPEVAQDFGEMGFSTPIKTADPGGFLFGALEAIAIALENAAHAVEVFAFTNEGFEFIS
jgi:hypothetical protein